MGNQLIKDYTIEKEPYGSAGLGNLWKIYRGVRTDASRRLVTIFILEKKQFKKIPKASREQIYTIIRREAAVLGRFRHSGILSLVEPLKEDEKMMAYVTERVELQLTSIIDPRKFGSYVQTELELKVRILEVIETLKFLHNDTKTVHLAVNPDNIYVMSDGKWKLGGILFACQVMPGTLVECPTINYFTPSPTQAIGVSLLPDVRYASPEIVSSQPRCALSGDIFSLGALLFTLVTLKPNDFQPHFLIEVRNAELYSEAYSKHREKLDKVPPSLRPMIERMVDDNALNRPSLEDVSRCHWLQDPILQALRHLQLLADKDFSSQQTFLQGLWHVFSRFEQKVLVTRVVPLLSNLLRLDQLSPLLLAMLFRLVDTKMVPKEDWIRVVWPGIVNMTRVAKELPAQTLFLLTHRLPLFFDSVPKDEFSSVLLPLVFRSFDSGVPRLQELCLKITEDFLARALDYTTVKAKVIPRVLGLCHDNSTETRKNALICLLHIHSLVDKTAMNEHVLMTLEKVRRLPNTSQINSLVLTIYQLGAKSLPVDVLASKLLASMVPVLVDPTINKRDFFAYYNTIMIVLQRIKEDRVAGFGTGPDPGDSQEEFRNEIVVQDISKEILKGEDRSSKAPSPEDWEFIAAIDPTFRAEYYAMPTRKASQGQPVHITQQQPQIQAQPAQPFTYGAAVNNGGFPPMSPTVVAGIPVFHEPQTSWQESPLMRSNSNQGPRPSEIAFGIPTNFSGGGNFIPIGITTAAAPKESQNQGGWELGPDYSSFSGGFGSQQPQPQPQPQSQQFIPQQSMQPQQRSQPQSQPQPQQFIAQQSMQPQQRPQPQPQSQPQPQPQQFMPQQSMQPQQRPASAVIQQPPHQNPSGQLPKGNLMKLDYDPFAGLGDFGMGTQPQQNLQPQPQMQPEMAPWTSPTFGVPSGFGPSNPPQNRPAQVSQGGPQRQIGGPQMNWKSPTAPKDIDLL
eukprot:TRINITY_DN1584_c0_g2_i1.p1 TRINITY_DN1584_c0_g2~~TRINITY_DN1584_c0_g2_i1.p1  ORF type:complete len:960 (-),score=147.21 TRINITY_DN1584_c0_g2_i1:2958-5837(-)